MAELSELYNPFLERSLDVAKTSKTPYVFRDARHFTNYSDLHESYHNAISTLHVHPREFKEFLVNNATLIDKMHKLNAFSDPFL